MVACAQAFNKAHPRRGRQAVQIRTKQIGAQHRVAYQEWACITTKGARFCAKRSLHFANDAPYPGNYSIPSESYCVVQLFSLAMGLTAYRDELPLSTKIATWVRCRSTEERGLRQRRVLPPSELYHSASGLPRVSSVSSTTSLK